MKVVIACSYIMIIKACTSWIVGYYLSSTNWKKQKDIRLKKIKWLEEKTMARRFKDQKLM